MAPMSGLGAEAAQARQQISAVRADLKLENDMVTYDYYFLRP